uniref:Uncharacterized protein n=1 Tax=Romanomermis culicivorax TaxID=13658 RepID=A0A915JXY6_ROMCU
MKSLVNETRKESTTTIISAEIVTEPREASAFQNLYDKFMKIFYPGNQENGTRNNVDEVSGSIIATNSMENS